MDLVAIIKQEWGWVGIDPARVLDENAFGNLLVQDHAGRIWRLMPEELSCEVIAESQAELAAFTRTPEFRHDWHMSALVREAQGRLGTLAPGNKYCLKIPGPLGGEYGGNNLGDISFGELIAASGHMARELEGLPDGTHIRLFVEP